MFDFLIHVFIMASLFGLLSLSLNFQAGFAGLMNFGQIALFGCGTYGAALAFSWGYGFVPGLLLGLAMSAVVAVIFAQLGRNLTSDYWGIATLAVAEVLRLIALNESWLTGGAQGIAGMPPLFPWLAGRERQYAILAFCVILLALVYLVCNRITSGRYGLALKLMREEPLLAASLGYDTNRLKRQAMVIGGLIAAGTGVIFAHYITFVGPEQLIGSETFIIWAMIIIGGLGNHKGAIAGAFVLQFLFAFVPFAKDLLGLPVEYVAAVRLLIVGGGLLGFLLLREKGLIAEKTGGYRLG